MNPTPSILKYMSAMDIDMLALILDESKTYQEATKEVFLEKLNVVFEKFKKENDTSLTPYPGVCKSTECSNTGCKGYSFVGNTSGTYIDLIFDDKAGEVHDIFYCHTMESEYQKLDDSNKINIYIGPEEEAAFVPSTEYLYQVQQSDKALKEILSYQDSYFSKEAILYLVHKYYDLGESLPDLFSGITRFRDFLDVYRLLTFIHLFIRFDDIPVNAITDFASSDMTYENNKIKWLLKYEEPGLVIINLLYTVDPSTFNTQTGTIEFEGRTNLKILREEFDAEFEFAKLFEKNYWAIINQYKSPDEIDTQLQYDLVFHDRSDKRLIDYLNGTEYEFKIKQHLVPDNEICKWVPFRYIAQGSNTATGIKLSKAHDLFHQDEFVQALEIYIDLLETRNDLQEAWLGLAVCHYMLKNYEEAVSASTHLRKWSYSKFLDLFTTQCELKNKEL